MKNARFGSIDKESTYLIDSVSNKEGEVVPLEFTKVAKKVMPAVVHIKSTQLEKVNNYQQRRYSDPFEHFYYQGI